jgi:hypothetical protein
MVRRIVARNAWRAGRFVTLLKVNGYGAGRKAKDPSLNRLFTIRPGNSGSAAKNLATVHTVCS